MLKQTKVLNKEPLNFESRCLNEQKLKDINNNLMITDWIGVLTGMTSDEKFNQFHWKLTEVMDEIAPIKRVRISAKRRFVEPWMTRGLDIASQHKLKLYKKSLMPTSTEEDLDKYRKYRNIYNTLRSRTRKSYY